MRCPMFRRPATCRRPRRSSPVPRSRASPRSAWLTRRPPRSSTDCDPRTRPCGGFSFWCGGRARAVSTDQGGCRSCDHTHHWPAHGQQITDWSPSSWTDPVLRCRSARRQSHESATRRGRWRLNGTTYARHSVKIRQTPTSLWRRFLHRFDRPLRVYQKGSAL